MRVMGGVHWVRLIAVGLQRDGRGALWRQCALLHVVGALRQQLHGSCPEPITAEGHHRHPPAPLQIPLRAEVILV
jgi:hypothetical protein